MKTFLESKVKQRFTGVSEKALKEYANGQGIIFAIVNPLGQVIATRKTYGSAYRAIEKRYLLRGKTTTEDLYVIAVDIQDLKPAA